MLSTEQWDEAAAILWKAFEEKRQQPPLSVTFPEMDMTDAYRIQERFVAARIAAGHTIGGYKIGLTSKAMQELAGVDEPDYGALLDFFFVENGAALASSDYIRPAVEIEIAFVMRDPLSGPGVTAADVIAATDYIVPAIELVDFRLDLKNRRKGIYDTVADLASCGAVILGGNRKSLGDVDLHEVAGRLVKNGETIEEGQATAVMGTPVNAIVWLANKLYEIGGVAFEPGHVILSGSFIKITSARPGDRFRAEFDNNLGEVAFDLA